jgi:hypothetical protein
MSASFIYSFPVNSTFCFDCFLSQPRLLPSPPSHVRPAAQARSHRPLSRGTRHTTTCRGRAPVTLDDFPVRELLLYDFGQEHFIEVTGDKVECGLCLGREDDTAPTGRRMYLTAAAVCMLADKVDDGKRIWDTLSR